MEKYQNIDEYIHAFPEISQRKLREMQQLIHQSVPDLQECIKYGIPTFVYLGKNLIHIGAFQKHVSVFPGAKAVAHFTELFTPYKQSKGAIQFPLEATLPLNRLRKLVIFCKNELEDRSHFKKVPKTFLG